MNEEKFTGKASVYAKFRPTYPEALFKYLYTEVGFEKAATIADIGAGTGIFSKKLLENGSAVAVVEPNADMLTIAQKELLAYSKCNFVRASAEATTLMDASVDFITVAQAFHWFHRGKFKAECQRILKKRGKVVLVWNNRDSEDALTLENAAINKTLCPAFKGFSGGSNQNPEAFAGFFRDGHCEYRVFTNHLFFDKEGFVGRNLSASYAPLPNTHQYDEYSKKIAALFDKYSNHGQITVKNFTHSYVGEV